MIQYIYAKYGRERAALTATVACYRAKSAIRDVGKALGLALDQVDQIASSLAWWDGFSAIEERLAERGFDPASTADQKTDEVGVTTAWFSKTSVATRRRLRDLRTALARTGAGRKRGHARAHHHPVGQGRSRHPGPAQGRCAGAGDVELYSALRGPGQWLALEAGAGSEKGKGKKEKGNSAVALRLASHLFPDTASGHDTAERADPPGKSSPSTSEHWMLPESRRGRDDAGGDSAIVHGNGAEHPQPCSVWRAFPFSIFHFPFPLLALATSPPKTPHTYAMLQAGDTVGVFQVESRAQMSMLPRLKPANFYDLVIEVAIVRPGPIQGKMVHPYLRRRQGLEEVSYPSEDLKRVFERTLGVPIFQEQVMQLAIVAAGFTPGEADQLRRSMAAWKRRGGMEHYRQRIIEGMTERGYETDFAEQVFEQIKGFGSYGFPESHAASFALLVYASAWLKCHHPTAFAAALLNAQPLGFYSVSQIIQDARRHGVEVRPVDVRVSGWEAALESGTRERGIGGKGEWEKGRAEQQLRRDWRLPFARGRTVVKRLLSASPSP